MKYKTRVWDLPTRIFHWALLACVISMVVTATLGGNAMTWHFRGGYAILTLLLFRLVWGVVGGRWSRFSSFIYAPSTVIGYLKGFGKPEHSVGHNPLGAASVFALIFFLLAQVGTGLFSDDEIASSGPLSKFVANATVSAATLYHKNIGKYVLILLVVLHIAAVLFYYYKKKENLIAPMIHGDKQLDSEVGSSRDDTRSRVTAAIVFALCVAAVASLVKMAG